MLRDPDAELRALLRRVRQVELRTRKAVNAASQGAYTSRFRGRGMAFSESRAYVAGDIELDPHSDDYESSNEHVTARPLEKNVYTLKLKRTCGLNVTVRDAQAKLPYAVIGEAIAVRDATGSNAVRSCVKQENRQRLKLEGPGTYKVTIDKLPGYQPVEPVTVEVPPGKFVEHEVKLQREP